MGRAKIDRTGEERLNNFGSKMIITKYNNNRDMDVYFPEYEYTIIHVTYGDFKKGVIKCPYEKRTYGKGYIGIGKYKPIKNGKITKCYDVWQSMLQRCYDDKYQEKYPTYKGCTVESHLLNFQNMGEWIENNYYEIPGERMHLDKDILCKGNKVYSRDTCIFVPQRINSLFVKCNKSRGKNPIGMTLISSGNYQVYCNNGYGKSDYLGTYSTKEEAFRVYKQYKEKIIKEVIDLYEGIIPELHYSKLKKAMYNYRVEIDD